MNFIKKHLILLIILAFTFNAARAHVFKPVTLAAPEKQQTKPMGKPVAIRLPANGSRDFTTIYARVYVTNVQSIVYGPSTDEWHEGNGLITIKFFQIRPAVCLTH